MYILYSIHEKNGMALYKHGAIVHNAFPRYVKKEYNFFLSLLFFFHSNVHFTLSKNFRKSRVSNESTA